MRYVLLVCYDGTAFSGSQKQARGERTVQGELERAAGGLFSQRTALHASGRTDAGVHAAGQIFHFDAQTSIPAGKLRECFNAVLPADCKVLASAAAPEGFDATRAVKKKTYCYRAYVAPCDHPILDRYAARLKKRPDLSAMREAARLLEGEHDFTSFSATGSSAKTGIRTLYAVEIAEKTECGYPMYEIRVTGNGFLYNMVRILAGEIFAVGAGKSTEAILAAFKEHRRSLLARTMPARGLVLERVEYQTPLFDSDREVIHGIF